MLHIHELPLPDHHGDPHWQAYQELLTRWNHELLGGPGWDVSAETNLAQSRAAENDIRVERFLAYSDAAALGYATLRINVRDDPEAGSVIVYVAPEARGAGVGRRLAARLETAVCDAGLARLNAWLETPLPTGEQLAPETGVGGVPAEHPGVRMAQAYGFVLEQVERVSRYDFAAPLVDPRDALAEARARAGDEYELLVWEDAAPDDLLDGIAALKRRMLTDPPTGGLVVAEANWDAARVREEEERYLPTVRIWRTAARHRPTGAVVALSELTRDRSNPEGLVGQGDTIVLPEHRGRRLGMLVKAANLIQVREASPDAEAILTWNAEENRYMLDVNEALGFRPYLVEGAFQRRLVA
ncbi:MAG: GNAT family N-acetyltransferase [Tessaracoccus sp.]|nr:GNAT family N-acetyltransferase [Tessaracoccus sp.]